MIINLEKQKYVTNRQFVAENRMSSESNKWVFGNEFNISPYAKIKYNITDKLNIYADRNISFINSQNHIGLC